MNSKLQVFISSTYEDLLAERQAAVQAVLKAGHIPAGMELFTSGDKSQWEDIKRWIDDSDVYMLILGVRYGSIEPESGNSYTHAEYLYAVEKKKPLFAVFISDTELQKRLPALAARIEGEDRKGYKAFRQLVLSKTSAPFEDVKDVKLAVMESLGRYAADPKLVGWVKGDEAANVAELANQLAATIKENASLRSHVTTLEMNLAALKGPQIPSEALESFGIEAQQEGKNVFVVTTMLQFFLTVGGALSIITHFTEFATECGTEATVLCAAHSCFLISRDYVPMAEFLMKKFALFGWIDVVSKGASHIPYVMVRPDYSVRLTELGRQLINSPPELQLPPSSVVPRKEAAKAEEPSDHAPEVPEGASPPPGEVPAATEEPTTGEKSPAAEDG